MKISAVESVEQGDRDGLLPVFHLTSFAPYMLVIQTNDIVFWNSLKYTVDDSFADRLVVQDPNLVKSVSKPHPCCIYAETQVSHDSKVPFLSCGKLLTTRSTPAVRWYQPWLWSSLEGSLRWGSSGITTQTWKKNGGKGCSGISIFSTPD